MLSQRLITGAHTIPAIIPEGQPVINYEPLTIDLTRADSDATLLSAPHPSQFNLARLLRRELEQYRAAAAASCSSGALKMNMASPHQAAALAICNAADTLVTCLLSHRQLQPAVDPQVQLQGNCFPVSETPPTHCVVEGNLPPDLSGAYIRNGPNATHLHNGEGFHIFDGDGMLQSVKFSDGAATFCARHVRTSRFVQEEAAGRPLFPKIFGAFTGISGMARTAVTFLRARLGLLDLSQGMGLSNASVCFFRGQVLSLSEDDMPYIIKVTESGDLLTQGRCVLPGKKTMCAHPKFDAETGNMYAFSNPPAMPPFSVFRISAGDDEQKIADVPVPLFDLPIVHDFAITRSYIIFPDCELVVRPLPFLKGEPLPVVRDVRKGARFCVLPRDIFSRPQQAAREARWFEAPGCNCLHYINAWEDEEAQEIVLLAPVLSPVENIISLKDISSPLTEIRMSTATGKVKSRELIAGGGNVELGTINQRYLGRKSKYVYLAQTSSMQSVTGVVKVDVEAGRIVARRAFDAGCSGGEPCFVPRRPISIQYNVDDDHLHDVPSSSDHAGRRDLQGPADELGEDDGYLLCFLYNSATRRSHLLVMDALSSSLEVISSVHLPTRVPFGFHGCFVSDEQLASQEP